MPTNNNRQNVCISNFAPLQVSADIQFETESTYSNTGSPGIISKLKKSFVLNKGCIGNCEGLAAIRAAREGTAKNGTAKEKTVRMN